MSDIVLYHMAPSRSSVVLWMLEEVGQPYEIRQLDGQKGENRQPDFLAINPMGKVPTLIHKGVTLTETAAICLFLADEYPQAGLTVPVGDPRRGPLLRWLVFGPACVEPAVVDKAFSRPDVRIAAAGWGNYDLVMDTLERTAAAASPWLLGEQFTVADVVLGSQIRWGMLFGLMDRRPAFEAYAGRLAERPALQRAEAKDEAMKPPPAAG